MWYLKLTSNTNYTQDYIELNDFNGFLCTGLSTLGISRSLEHLAISNRQTVVGNKPEFKKYNLTIEILSKYSDYERKYEEFASFIDRNKKDGLRLYFKPDDNSEMRYILCDVESVVKNEKKAPIGITLVQCSLWLGDEKKETTAQVVEDDQSMFAFKLDTSGNDYYCVSFFEDTSIEDYYSVAFASNTTTQATINIGCYNEVPLRIRIYGACVNPEISLFRKGEGVAIRQIKILRPIAQGYHIEINANIFNSGVWYVSPSGERFDYNEFVDNSLGSPYIFLSHGEYYLEVEDVANNTCTTDVFWQEEYSR